MKRIKVDEVLFESRSASYFWECVDAKEIYALVVRASKAEYWYSGFVGHKFRVVGMDEDTYSVRVEPDQQQLIIGEAKSKKRVYAPILKADCQLKHFLFEKERNIKK